MGCTRWRPRWPLRWLAFSVVACAVQADKRPLPSRLDIGFHLSPLIKHPITGEDFRTTSTREFLDVMKHSTPFNQGIEQGLLTEPRNWVNYGIPADSIPTFRSDGYPVNLTSFLLSGTRKYVSVKSVIGLGGAYVEDGVYSVTWQGNGNLSFEGDAQLLNASGQSAWVLVRPSTGVVIRILATDEANPLRSLSCVHSRLLPLNGTQVFHPQFLQALKGASVIRFAGWQQVDVWDTAGSLGRSWSDRPLPSDQTQAGPFGVAVEHMVQLANVLGANPWFSMPKAANVGPTVVDPYAAAFAQFVLQTLRSDLKVYVEYRTCCLNGLAPGWSNQENAMQSLTLWNTWESYWNSSRVVNTMSALAQMDNYGNDIARVEAAAIDVSFGALCSYGWKPCTAYDDIEAWSVYGTSTPEGLIDQVLRPAMLKKEAEANQAIQQALHYNFEVVAFNALPYASARNYGHRGTLNWALQCETCLMTKVAHRYGLLERNNYLQGGYVFEENFYEYFAYQGLGPQDRVNGTYWAQTTPPQAKTLCDGMPDCGGFLYVKSGEWSCAPTGQFRYGNCATPGTAYFFNTSRRISGYATRSPPTSCTAWTVPGTEDCSPGRVDTYWKADTRPIAVLNQTEEWAKGNCSVCTAASQAQWYTFNMPPEGLTLDRLHQYMPMLIQKAAQEQALEAKMMLALRSDTIETLTLDYLDRLRNLGIATVVAGTLHRDRVSCRSGGKACGIASLMTNPDDNGPVRRAFTSYSLGVRAPPREVDPPPAACAQPCVYGVCESGSCRCWARASGADCSALDSSPRCERLLGLSLGGISYWTREWPFVDVMKHVGMWNSQEFTSYAWNTATTVNLRDDGYPAYLYVNQALQVLTVRDIERHYVDGWYTVLYDGEGVLDFNMDVTAIVREKPGRIKVYLQLQTTGNNGLGIRISHTREDNPIRNIRAITPGFEQVYATSPFHPAFKASLKRFSVLRFMDWMNANNRETPWAWSDRAKSDFFTQGSYKGVSLEYMVWLSNEMGAAPWFALPINCTDDYIQNFATYVAQALRPDVPVYMELGNEDWHTGFYGGQWATQRGAAIGLSRFCWVAKRTAEMAAIARPILEPRRRLIVVVSTQASNADATRQFMNCQGINASDAFGLAPYFDGYGVLPNPDTNLTRVLLSYDSEVDKSVNQVVQHKALLQGTKFKLVLYEAGPGGEGSGSGTDLAIQAHRHPDMRRIVKRYLDALSVQVDLIVYFASCGVPSKYGSWGMIEAMDQPRDEAPKYLAVQDFLNANNTCPATSSCEAFAGCGGKGVCGADGLCYCYRGYSGSTCLSASYTDYSACGYRCTFDQGLCVVSAIVGTLRAWNCSCQSDYGGATCTRFTCPNGCNQRGHCIASGVCSCFRGYLGNSCEVDCGCNHHGQCDSKGQCICDKGWRKNAQGGCELDCDTAKTLGCTGPGQSACGGCQMGTCFSGVCRCWAGYYGPQCSQLNASIQANFNGVFGINVAMTPSTFVDVMKTSNTWTSVWQADTFAGQFSYQGNSLLWENRQYEWGNGQSINQTADGYIASMETNQAVIALLLRDVCRHAPSGRYVVTYDGEGELDFGMDSRPAAFSAGRIDIDVSLTCNPDCWFDKQTWRPYCTDNGIGATLRRTNPDNPLRNVHVVMPGFLAVHEAEPFHPWFLKNLERFSFVRFMDWGHTNEEGFLKRTPALTNYLRFTTLSTRGGGAPRMAEIMVRTSSGASIPCTSPDVPAICDGDVNTDWAPSQLSATSGGANLSFTVILPTGSLVSNYVWITSGWDFRVDPLSWRLEGSVDNVTWTLLDLRSSQQPVTNLRRVVAATSSPEENTWYPLRLPSDLLQWADRTLPTHRSQANRPVALEYQALLVNTLGAAPWVCVHHLASDDYVRQEARFWLTNLRPDVKVYVEHSNEVWNPLFPQGRYATQMGISLGLVNSTCRTSQCARVRYNAYRSKQIFDIWKEVWAAQRSRLQLVLSTQMGWFDVTKDLLSLNNGAGADMVGITAYMGPTGAVDYTYSAKSITDVIGLFRAGIEPTRATVRDVKALASTYGMRLAVYEGGVGLVESGAIESGKATGAVTELLIATGRSPLFKPAVQEWLDMFRAELGDQTPFGYFVDTGFWSKYGQWGMREYYDAATTSSPAATAVHAHLDARYGPRPRCVVADSRGRGLPPDSFLGPPAVLEPQPQANLVVGSLYRVAWASERLAPGMLDLYLWRRTSCSGDPVPIGSAQVTAGSSVWRVPDVPASQDYFIELRPRAVNITISNYSAFFSIVPADRAPLDYLLYVENDVDLLSAFHRDCSGGQQWAIRQDFKISSCVYSSAEGCRTYRTSRKTQAVDGPPPWRHGSGLPMTDCTLHIVGIRQTMNLEGLQRGFDFTAQDNLARLVANASQLPPGAVAITVSGGAAGRRLAAETGVVTVELSVSSDDNGIATAVLGLATLSGNMAFAKAASSSLGADLVIKSGNITAVDGSSLGAGGGGNSSGGNSSGGNSSGGNSSGGNTSGGGGGGNPVPTPGPGTRCVSLPQSVVSKLMTQGWMPASCSR